MTESNNNDVPNPNESELKGVILQPAFNFSNFDSTKVTFPYNYHIRGRHDRWTI